MKKCKDCIYFKNECGFAVVDKKFNHDGEFEACGRFKCEWEQQKETFDKIAAWLFQNNKTSATIVLDGVGFTQEDMDIKYSVHVFGF